MPSRSFVILPAWALSAVAAILGFLPVRAQNGETLSYYTLRFEFATTSDWSTITIDSTRGYVQRIYGFYNIYRALYGGD